jgi:predicted HNH restriction endonuclease
MRYFLTLRSEIEEPYRLDSEFSGVSREEALERGLPYVAKWRLEHKKAKSANKSQFKIPTEWLRPDDLLWVISIRKDRVYLIGRARMLPNLETFRSGAREGEPPRSSRRRFAWREATKLSHREGVEITNEIGQIFTTLKSSSQVRPRAESFDVSSGVERLRKYLKNRPPQEITEETALFLDSIIRISNSSSQELPSSVVTDSTNSSTQRTENRLKLKTHLARERNRTLRRHKIRSVIQSDGKLLCEICSFDFEERYGDLGRGFAEVHHKIALSSISGETVTTIDDLAVLCSNCHRMIHRTSPMENIDTFKSRLQKH